VFRLAAAACSGLGLWLALPKLAVSARAGGVFRLKASAGDSLVYQSLPQAVLVRGKQ